MNHHEHFTLTPRLKPLSVRRNTTLSVLDIGDSKVVCLIADLHPVAPENSKNGKTHVAHIIGIGHQISSGMKRGAIVDLEATEYAIRHAVSSAERMARAEVQSVIVNVSGGRLASLQTKGQVSLDSGMVNHSDIANVLDIASQHHGQFSRALAHSIPVSYQLDNQEHIIDPIGMAGEKLGVKMHLISTDTSLIKNLTLVIERCRLKINSFVATPYASGLSVLTDDEMDMGCVLLDIGCGTTSIGVFDEGCLVHADAFAIGGNHISMDIARGLGLRHSTAERLKLMHGTAFWIQQDDRNIITIPNDPETGNHSYQEPRHISKGRLSRIIQPRVEEIFEFAKSRLLQAGFTRHMKQCIVLTGGTSQLNGISEIATYILGEHSRIGQPERLKGLPDAASSPLFSTAVGLLRYPQVAHTEYFESYSNKKYAATGTHGYFSRVGQWIKESF